MMFAEIISSIGVFLILLAFFLQTFHLIKSQHPFYLVMNAVGAALACYGSYLIQFIPFVILEGTWCMVSIVGLFRVQVPNNTKSNQ